MSRLGGPDAMTAAVIEAMRTDPVVRLMDRPHPSPGQLLVAVSTAGVNPTDLVASTGVRGDLPVPYVPGTEGVGITQDGRRVYFAPTEAPHGSMAEYSIVAEDRVFDVADALTDADALGIGIAGSTAWLAMSWKADMQPGESVLVLGATGAVGQIAVQAAKLQGAGRVVAAGRNVEVLGRLRSFGADDVVELSQGYESRLIEAAHGGFDLVVDSLFAEPLAAALPATKYGGRIVNLGMRAGRLMQVSGLALKGRDLLNYNMDMPPLEVHRAVFEQMSRHIIAGDLIVRAETMQLHEVADAWRRQAASPSCKLVVEIGPTRARTIRSAQMA